MAIHELGEWWVGSEPADIETYLVAYTATKDTGRVSVCRLLKCACGSERFFIIRAGSTTRRICSGCAYVGFISRFGDGTKWEEAVENEPPEAFRCVECDSDSANVGVGFSSHPSAPLAVRWFYLGVRCPDCGLLGCFNDGKVNRGPATEVYREVIGEH